MLIVLKSYLIVAIIWFIYLICVKRVYTTNKVSILDMLSNDQCNRISVMLMILVCLILSLLWLPLGIFYLICCHKKGNCK